MRDLLRDLVYLFSGEWARGMFSRPYISASELRAALDGIKADLHDDSIRAHEPVQVPMGTFGLLTGQHWD